MRQPGRTAYKSPVGGGNDLDLVEVLEPTHEELEMCAVLNSIDPDDTDPVDAEKSAHDKHAVASVWTEAVQIAKVKHKTELNSDEAQTALGSFLKV